MEKTWDIMKIQGVDYVRVDEKVRTAIRLQELVEEEWIRLLELSKKPMDSFTHAQFKIIRHLIETSQGIEPDYIDTKFLVEK